MSTAFAPFCYPYVNLLNFAIISTQISTIFFFQKNRNSGKKRKNHMPDPTNDQNFDNYLGK